MTAQFRLSVDDYFINMARLVAMRGTCLRRRVGCVLVDSRNHVLGTGYNGVPADVPHCLDAPCAGIHYSSGLGLDKCSAIHAEQNALLQCRDVRQIATAYITCSPCHTCTKLLMNTSCKKIIFYEPYTDQSPKDLWHGEWRHHEPNINVFTRKYVDSAR